MTILPHSPLRSFYTVTPHVTRDRNLRHHPSRKIRSGPALRLNPPFLQPAETADCPLSEHFGIFLFDE